MLLRAELLHDRLDELLGSVHATENRLEVEGGLGGVAGGGAVDAVLAYQDKRVGEQVERHGKAAALDAQHEFVPFEFGSLFVEDIHAFSVTEGGG